MGSDEIRDGVELTHLDGPLLDGSDVTKRDLINYLDAMADRLVPALARRPLSVMRVRPGQAPFMQKNLAKNAPDWVARTEVWAERTRRTIVYPLCDDRRTLLWLANQRAVEFHPTLYRVGEERPSHLVLDIDPPEGHGFEVVVRAAALIRSALDSCGLQGAVKTSGAKGAHVFVPIENASAEEAAAASRALAARAEALDPALTTTAFVREDRGGRVFLDSTRAGGASVACVYSPRLRDGLPVSFPLRWDELESVDPRELTIRTALARLGDRDPWREHMPAPQRIPAELLDHGRTIPVARVLAMHAGKRRAAARRAAPENDH